MLIKITNEYLKYFLARRRAKQLSHFRHIFEKVVFIYVRCTCSCLGTFNYSPKKSAVRLSNFGHAKFEPGLEKSLLLMGEAWLSLSKTRLKHLRVDKHHSHWQIRSVFFDGRTHASRRPFAPYCSREERSKLRRPSFRPTVRPSAFFAPLPRLRAVSVRAPVGLSFVRSLAHSP